MPHVGCVPLPKTILESGKELKDKDFRIVFLSRIYLESGKELKEVVPDALVPRSCTFLESGKELKVFKALLCCL